MSSSDFANVYASINNLQNQFDAITGNTLSSYNQVSRIVAQQGNIYNSLYYGSGNINTLKANINGVLNLNGSSLVYSNTSGNSYSDIGLISLLDTNATSFSGHLLLRTGKLVLYQSGIGSYDNAVSGLTGYTGLDGVIQFRPSNPISSLGYSTYFGFPYSLSANTYTTYPQIFCIGQENGGNDPEINCTFHASRGLQITNSTYYSNWTNSMTTMTDEALRINGDTYISTGDLRLQNGNLEMNTGNLILSSGIANIAGNIFSRGISTFLGQTPFKIDYGISNSATNGTVTFNITFTNPPIVTTGMLRNGDGAIRIWPDVTTTGFTWYCYNMGGGLATCQVQWIAIGI